MKRYTIFLALLFFRLNAFAAEYGVLKGRVTDENGRALGGATIRLQGTQKGAYSRADGSYRIGNIPVGSYEVQASYIGREDHRQWVRIKSGGEMELGFVLRENKNRRPDTVDVSCGRCTFYPYTECIIAPDPVETAASKVADSIRISGAAPNPARNPEGWTVSLESQVSQTLLVELTNYEGNSIWREQREVPEGESSLRISSISLCPGWYLLRLQGKSGICSIPLVLR